MTAGGLGLFATSKLTLSADVWYPYLCRRKESCCHFRNATQFAYSGVTSSRSVTMLSSSAVPSRYRINAERSPADGRGKTEAVFVHDRQESRVAEDVDSYNVVSYISWRRCQPMGEGGDQVADLQGEGRGLRRSVGEANLLAVRRSRLLELSACPPHDGIRTKSVW